MKAHAIIKMVICVSVALMSRLVLAQEILARLPQEGYDPELLRRTVHVDEAKENESGYSKEN
jgi:hypothetical protein